MSSEKRATNSYKSLSLSLSDYGQVSSGLGFGLVIEGFLTWYKSLSDRSNPGMQVDFKPNSGKDRSLFTWMGFSAVSLRHTHLSNPVGFCEICLTNGFG